MTTELLTASRLTQNVRCSRRLHPGRRAAGRALTILVVSAAVLWGIFLRPPLLGGNMSYIIVSGRSMLPTLENGDLVLAQRGNVYSKGDVLAYAVPEGVPGAGVLIIHRVIGGDARRGYILQGDNREGADPWRPQPRDIRGEMIWSLPRAGLVFAYMGTPLGLAALAALIAFFLVLPRKDSRPKDKQGSPAAAARDTSDP